MSWLPSPPPCNSLLLSLNGHSHFGSLEIRDLIENLQQIVVCEYCQAILSARFNEFSLENYPKIKKRTLTQENSEELARIYESILDKKPKPEEKEKREKGNPLIDPSDPVIATEKEKEVLVDSFEVHSGSSSQNEGVREPGSATPKEISQVSKSKEKTEETKENESGTGQNKRTPVQPHPEDNFLNFLNANATMYNKNNKKPEEEVKKSQETPFGGPNERRSSRETKGNFLNFLNENANMYKKTPSSNGNEAPEKKEEGKGSEEYLNKIRERRAKEAKEQEEKQKREKEQKEAQKNKATEHTRTSFNGNPSPNGNSSATNNPKVGPKRKERNIEDEIPDYLKTNFQHNNLNNIKDFLESKKNFRVNKEPPQSQNPGNNGTTKVPNTMGEKRSRGESANGGKAAPSSQQVPGQPPPFNRNFSQNRNMSPEKGPGPSFIPNYARPMGGGQGPFMGGPPYSGGDPSRASAGVRGSTSQTGRQSGGNPIVRNDKIERMMQEQQHRRQTEKVHDPKTQELIQQLVAAKPWLDAPFLSTFTGSQLRSNFLINETEMELDPAHKEKELKHIRENVLPTRDKPANSKQDTELVNEIRYFARNREFAVQKMAKKTFYGRLDLSSGCSDSELKKSYKTKVLLYHPDNMRRTFVLFAHHEQFEQFMKEMFQMVDEAYKTLINKEKRKTYDQSMRVAAPIKKYY